MRSRQDLSKASVFGYWAAVGFFLLVTYTFGRTKLDPAGFFWDGRVYARAIAVWHAGGDPYAGSSNALLFVGPPLFLKTAGQLGLLFRSHTGWYLYIAAVIVGMVAIPYLLARAYIRGQWMTPALAMLLLSLQPRFIVERSMNTGNLAIPLYALALFAGSLGLRRERWVWFYSVVAIAGLIKPAFLALLLLSMLSGRRRYWQSAVTVFFVLAAYGLQRLTLPKLYRGFEQAAYQQVVVKHDFGIGTFDCLFHASGRLPILRSMVVLSGIHGLLLGIIVCGLFLLRRSREHPLVAPIWVPTLVVAAIVANPRMQDYDSCVAIVPALYICIERAKSACAGLTGTAITAIGVNLLLVLFTTSYEVALNVLFFGAITLTALTAFQARKQVGQATEELSVVGTRLL